MSYILNALRKSEQERRSGQVPTLQHGFPDNHLQPPGRKSWLIVGLLIFNLIALGVFFWFDRRSPDANEGVSPQLAAAGIAVPPVAQTDEPTDATQPQRDTVVAAAPPPHLAQQAPSIADRVADRKAHKARLQQSSGPEPRPAKEDTSKQIAAAKPGTEQGAAVAPPNKTGQKTESEQLAENSPPSLSNAASDLTVKQPGPDTGNNEPEPAAGEPEPAKAARADNAGAARTAPPIRLSHLKSRLAGNKTFAQAHQNKIFAQAHQKQKQATGRFPLLKEMPYEFRRRVPELNINVYVYDDNPDKRFIMVDMTRFAAGQQLADGLDLKEILADSLVVSFEGKTFRIQRP